MGGTLVSVQGLQSATQHNGKTGEIVEYDAAKTMYIVKLNADSNGTARHEDEMISVKPINLHLHLPRSVSKEGAPVLGLNDDEDDDINANDNDAELELEDVESTSRSPAFTSPSGTRENSEDELDGADPLTRDRGCWTAS